MSDALVDKMKAAREVLIGLNATDEQMNALADVFDIGYDAIEALRAENQRLREISRWNIERDGDDIYICESNHDKGDKCEYERWYHRAYVEALRAELAEYKRLNENYDRNIKEIHAAYALEHSGLRAENEKLQEKLNGMLHCSEAYDAMAKLCSETEWTLKEEITRLRDLIKRLANTIEFLNSTHNAGEGEDIVSEARKELGESDGS